MQNGSLDGVMVNLDGGNEFGINKAAPNVLTSKNLWMGHVYLVVINQKVWDNLDRKDQKPLNVP